MIKRSYLLSVLFTAGLAVTGSAQTVNINCGGIAFTASNGTQWSADQDFSGGDLLYSGASIAGVAAQDLNLYRSGRAGLYSDFSYTIPVPNGSYTVTLGFAEIQYAAPGQRVFNVILNGTTVLSNFDILTQVAPLTPYTQQFPVTVTNGAVQLAFNGVTARGLVNAIQIAPGSGSSTSSSSSGSSSSTTSSGAPALSLGSTALSFTGMAAGANPAGQSVSVTNSGTGTLTWSATSNSNWLTLSPSSGTGAGSIGVQPNLSGLAAGTYTGSITVTAAGASGSPATVAVTLTIAADPPPPTTASSVNINCGGIAMTTSDGTTWAADEDFTNGEVLYASSSIANAAAADYYLYRSARAGLYTDFSYAIPVSNGSYVVTLRFAELQYSAAGQRVFNVVLNGTTVLSNFDILANVAPLTPLVQQFPVTVTNGAIQLAFNGIVNRGIINAIQVTPGNDVANHSAEPGPGRHLVEFLRHRGRLQSHRASCHRHQRRRQHPELDRHQQRHLAHRFARLRHRAELHFRRAQPERLDRGHLHRNRHRERAGGRQYAPDRLRHPHRRRSRSARSHRIVFVAELFRDRRRLQSAHPDRQRFQ